MTETHTTPERVKALIVEHWGATPENVTETATLVGDLQADSLDIVELIMALEEEFGIEITDDEGEQLAIVGDIVKLIDGKARA